MDVIIYHDPECGTSRNTLGLIRNAGKPHIVKYLKMPATRGLLERLRCRWPDERSGGLLQFHVTCRDGCGSCLHVQTDECWTHGIRQGCSVGPGLR